MDGYIRYNDSPFAPVQEEVDRSLPAGNFNRFSSTIRYIRAGSPRIARWLYQMERDQESKSLEARQGPSYVYRISGLTPFVPRDWPGLERLEVTTYRWNNCDSWTFALLRGRDILLVSYTGSVRWEDCLPLFLEALDT